MLRVHCHHLVAKSGVRGFVPEASGFDQRVSDPAVGVGGGVGIKELPLAVLGPAQQTAGKTGSHIAAGEVGLGPGEYTLEVRAVVVSEREEERVGLAFRGGAPATLRIDDSSLLIDKVRGVSVPQVPRALPSASAARAQD